MWERPIRVYVGGRVEGWGGRTRVAVEVYVGRPRVQPDACVLQLLRFLCCAPVTVREAAAVVLAGPFEPQRSQLNAHHVGEGVDE